MTEPLTRMSVQTTCPFNVPAEKVWRLIAGFNTLPDYHSSIIASELHEGGAVRHITLSQAAGGGVVVERLVQFDEDEKTFSYRIIDLVNCSLPFRNYQARVKLTPTGDDSCRLDWGSQFDIEPGSSVSDAETLAREIYQGCYDGIGRVLGLNQ